MVAAASNDVALATRFYASAQEQPRHFDGADDTAVDLWWQIGALRFSCHCPYRRSRLELVGLGAGAAGVHLLASVATRKIGQVSLTAIDGNPSVSCWLI